MEPWQVAYTELIWIGLLVLLELIKVWLIT